MSQPDIVIAGTESDDPFAIDIARFLGVREEVADQISLKKFANSEFCPRFILDERHEPGYGLAAKEVAIVSTHSAWLSRNDLAMRTLLTARAARDNGAAAVTLVEPDLFYSAQDRGPRADGDPDRTVGDRRRFDGQPFSSRLYAEGLALAGVSRVVTVHNHSPSVGRELERCLSGPYENLSPAPVFADYARTSDVVDLGDDGSGLVICAPDAGAQAFAEEIRQHLGASNVGMLRLEKKRTGERAVTATVSPESELGLGDLEGRDVLIVDDMVRTGSTIVECCGHVRRGRPRRVVFAVTHFYSSEESRECLSNRLLDEIVTTNTIPTALNRDMQGRLRRKMVVLKLERWIADHLRGEAGPVRYGIDLSSKNPRAAAPGDA